MTIEKLTLSLAENDAELFVSLLHLLEFLLVGKNKVSTILLRYSVLHVRTFPLQNIKGVMSRLRVDALSELCSPILNGGNSAFIAAIASGLCPQNEISTAWMVQLERKWDLITEIQ